MRTGSPRYLPVDGELAPFVERVWWWSGPGPRQPVLLPGTGAEWWIHHGEPPRYRTSTGLRSLPQAHVVCLRHEHWALETTGPLHVTAVRFRAGAPGRIWRCPVDEVTDRPAPLAEVLADAARADALVEGVRHATTPAARAAVLRAGVRALLAGHRGADPRVTAAVRTLYRDPGEGRVGALGEAVGLSNRQLRRGFAAAAGVGPKEFQRLVRFQRTARALLLRRGVPGTTPQEAPLDVALAAGYYDQSHLIKEFRRLAGRSPGRLMAAEMSHFYYQSLPVDAQAAPHDHRVRPARGPSRPRP